MSNSDMDATSDSTRALDMENSVTKTPQTNSTVENSIMDLDTTGTTSQTEQDSGALSDPLSSQQMTSESSNRLVFENAEGGNYAAKKVRTKGKRKIGACETQTLSGQHKHSLQSLDEADSNSVQSSDSDIEPVAKLARVDDDTDKDDTLVASENEDSGNNAGPFGVDILNKSQWTGIPSNLVDDDSDVRSVQSPADEFTIVDDIEGDANGEGGDDSEDELDDDEIYAWLEEGIEKKEVKSKPGTTNSWDFETREKTVLQEKGRNHFEMLPEGWVSLTHNSGMPIFLHRATRVCSMSKPYFIGHVGVRKHDIPVSSIPCLHYRREKEKEQQSRASPGPDPSISGTTVDPAGTRVPATNGDVADSPMDVKDENITPILPTDSAFPTAKLTSVEEVKRETSIAPEDLTKYCAGLFQFKTIPVKTFNTWKEKRKYARAQKRTARPGLPSDTTLITCPIVAKDNNRLNSTASKKKEFVFNPNGKTPLCVLHEYAQHVLKVQPTYKFTELDNAEMPYSATVLINDIAYCTGQSSSKKLAKAEAAKMTLEVLIPSLADTMDWGKDQSKIAREKQQELNCDVSFFNNIAVDDPRVAEMSNTAALPRPYQVLLVCLQRNFGIGDTSLKIDKKVFSNQKTEFSLTVGKHTATVVCKNKKEGKQRAAQAMLKLLHTHITNWGSMLRLYGKGTVHGFQERENDPVTDTQFQQTEKNQMNTAVIEKLKDAMRKVKSMRENVTKGTMHVPAASLQRSVLPIDL